MKKIAALLLPVLCVFMLMLPLCAAEEDYWICPACGRGGNRGDSCVKCGAARPEQIANENLTQIPGETDRVSVNILRIEGSAYVSAKKDPYLYAPWMATDGDAATCWQFSAKGIKKDPPGLYMIIEGETVDEIWIRNGFQGSDRKGNPLYPAYARLKDIVVELMYSEENAEPDIMEFTLTDGLGSDWEKLEIGRHENVWAVQLTVRSVYRGKSKPDNACLSEIMLVQCAPAETAMPPLE